MTNLDTGTQGAKRQSYRPGSPRELLKHLLEKNPDATEKQLAEIFEEAALKRPDLLPAIIEYWFANNYRSLMRKPPTPEARAKRNAVVIAAQDHIKAAAIEMVLLDFVMPNGKALRDATGSECKKAGGWFVKIAKRVGTKQIVGKVLSEADVQKMYRG